VVTLQKHANAFAASPSVFPHAGLDKHLSAFNVEVMVATQYWLAEHLGPSTWSELLHKHSGVFFAVPSLFVHSAGLVQRSPSVLPPAT
jgi:hypothetical protein